MCSSPATASWCRFSRAFSHSMTAIPRRSLGTSSTRSRAITAPPRRAFTMGVPPRVPSSSQSSNRRGPADALGGNGSVASNGKARRPAAVDGPSGRPLLHFLHGGVRALLLLRHASAARPLYGEAAPSGAARWQNRRLRPVHARTDLHLRLGAIKRSALLPCLRSLHQSRLLDADTRRNRGRSLAWQNARGDAWCTADVRWPFPHGLRFFIPDSAIVAGRRRRAPEGQPR